MDRLVRVAKDPEEQQEGERKMNKNMTLYVEPAWKYIPENPRIADVRALVNELAKEVVEVQEAVTDYENNPTGKNLAHVGEELADVVTRAATCFAAIESMDVVPCEDFTESCLAWVRHKNHSRGYHNRLSQREVEWG